MRRIATVIEEYSDVDQTDAKKITIIEWFQRHPGKRFDLNEIHGALGDELDVGERRTQEYLNELTDDGVLQSRGDQRRGYQLADDIIVPARYQVQAVLQHMGALFDAARWGPAGVLTVATAIWLLLTIPFWVLGGSLFVYPMDSYGSVSQSDFLTLAVAMTLWLLVFVTLSTVAYRWHVFRES